MSVNMDKMKPRTPRGHFQNHNLDRSRSTVAFPDRVRRARSVSRLPIEDARYDRVPRPGASPDESPRDVKPLAGRGRQKSRQDSQFVAQLNSTGPIQIRRPSTTEQKDQSAVKRGIPVDPTELFNRGRARRADPRKSFVRSNSLPSKIDRVVRQNIRPTSQRPLDSKGKKILSELAKKGSKPIPIAGKKRTASKEELDSPPPPPLPSLYDAIIETQQTQKNTRPPKEPAALTIFKPEKRESNLDIPEMSPGRAPAQDPLNLSDSFLPQGKQRQVDFEEYKGEDQGGGEANAVSPRSPIESVTKLDIIDQYYFLAYVMDLIDDTFEWTTLKDLQPHAAHITRLLNSEIQERGIRDPEGKPFEVTGIKDWLVANEILMGYDGPNLSKMMDRILSHLQENQLFTDYKPSAWQLLFILQNDMDIANTITRLDFDNLGLADRAILGLRACAGLPPCLGRLCLRKVKYVSFDGNYFRAVPPMLFMLVPNMETLSFNRNYFTQFPTELFFDARKLFEVYLSGQLDKKGRSITEMPYNIGIWNQTRLNKRYIKIDLSHNKIKEVNAHSFTMSTTNILPVEINMKGNPTDIRLLTEKLREVGEMAKKILDETGKTDKKNPVFRKMRYNDADRTLTIEKLILTL